MTRICLLSDTHAHIDDQTLRLCESADEIWHAGDIGNAAVTDRLAEIAPVQAVYGNIDGAALRRQWPEHWRAEREGVRVWMTHIGGYPGRYAPAIKPAIFHDPPDLFVCGHSHILKVMRDQKLNLLHMNPGAMGLEGFHKVRSLLRFNLQDGRVTDLEVAELKR